MEKKPRLDNGIGFIKLFRKLQDHWLWEEKPFTKGQAWIDILMECNHKQQKVNIGNNLITCNIGESLNSLETWATRWGWNKSKVRRFLKLLKTDTMVDTKPTQQTTHLIVLNYATYSDWRITDESQMNRKRNASETQVTPNNNVKNVKNVKNDKKEDIYTRIEKFKNEINKFVEINTKYKSVEQIFISHWIEKNKSGNKFRYEEQRYFDVGKRLGTFLKNNSKDKNGFSAKPKGKLNYG